MQQCIPGEVLVSIAESAQTTVPELLLQDEAAFIKSMASVHLIRDTNAMVSTLKSIRMISDDLSVSGLLQFHQTFDFEMLCLGDEIGPKKTLKAYIKALRPQILSDTVFNREPDTLAMARQFATSSSARYQSLPVLSEAFRDER
jgi:hypothetical protein